MITFTYMRFCTAAATSAVSLLNHICGAVLNIWPRGGPNSGKA